MCIHDVYCEIYLNYEIPEAEVVYFKIQRHLKVYK